MKTTILTLLILIYPTKSFAYLDPGLGGVILQSIIGGLAAFVGVISIYWNKFKSIFTKKNKKEKNIDENK